MEMVNRFSTSGLMAADPGFCPLHWRSRAACGALPAAPGRLSDERGGVQRN